MSRGLDCRDRALINLLLQLLDLLRQSRSLLFQRFELYFHIGIVIPCPTMHCRANHTNKDKNDPST
jgi:hypothetical protein